MHAMFRSDNLAGTTQGKYLASVCLPAECDNGCVVIVGDLKANEREVKNCSAPTGDEALGTIAVLGSEEVVKSKAFNTVGGFTNASGSIARAYILEKGDVFSVTADALTVADGVTITAGSTLFELQAGYKLKAVASATSGKTTVGKCEAIESDGATTWYVIRVM